MIILEERLLLQSQLVAEGVGSVQGQPVVTWPKLAACFAAGDCQKQSNEWANAPNALNCGIFFNEKGLLIKLLVN